ncbi:MAG: hypothetical protein RL685_2717 [Pseudomonadota bacterium]
MGSSASRLRELNPNLLADTELLSCAATEMWDALPMAHRAAASAFHFQGLICIGALLRCTGDEEEPTCNDLASRAVMEVSDAVQAVSRSCSEDSQCALVEYSPRCTDGCNMIASVATSAVSMVNAEVQDTNATSCASFEANECPIVPLTCVPAASPPLAVCRNGLCERDYLQ